MQLFIVKVLTIKGLTQNTYVLDKKTILNKMPQLSFNKLTMTLHLHIKKLLINKIDYYFLIFNVTK